MKKSIINALVYAFMFIAIQSIAGLGVHAIWQQVVGGTDITTTELVITIMVFSLLTIIIFLSARWTEISPRWLLTKQWAVLIWAVIAALGMVIPFTWLQENMPELPNWIEDQQEQLLSNYWGYLAIGLMAPLAEEIVFRGAILRTLLSSRLSPYGAIAISAALFALIHMNPAQMPHAFLIGLLLGWMYYRTDSIVPGVVYHWVNNTVAYVLYNFYPDPDMRLIDLFGSQRSVLMALVFSLCIFLPSLYQLHLRLRK